MELTQGLADLTNLDAWMGEDTPLNIGLVFGISLEPNLVLLRVPTEDAIEQRVRMGAIAWLCDLGRLDKHSYNVGHRLSETEMAVAAVDEIPLAETLMEALGGFAFLPELADTNEMAKVTFVVTLLWKADGKRCALVRRVTPGRFLLKRKGAWRAILSNGSFQTFDEEVVQLDDRHDLVLWDNSIFVVAQESFEALFGLGQIKHEHVAGVLQALCERLPVSDPDAFVALMASDRRYFRKLESIRSRNLLDGRTVEHIEAFVLSQELGIVFIDHPDKGRVIRVDTSPQFRQALMALLDDDNLSSGFSGFDYEANSKRQRTKGTV